MATQGVTGIGVSFRRWDGTDWVELAEVINIGGPTLSRATVEVVSLNASNAFKNFLAGYRDSGNVTFTMVFRRDTYEVIKEDYDSDSNANYEIYIEEAEETSFEFEGLVTEMPLVGIAGDSPITVDVTIKIDGEMTLNSGSGSAA